MKFKKKVSSLLIAATLVVGSIVPAFADGTNVVTIGVNNTAEQRAKIFKYFGVNENEVQVLEYTSSAVNTLSKYYVKNGRIYHGISTNLASSNYGSALDYGPKPSYLKEGVDYYSYDGHYFYEGGTYASYAKMLNDYRNNTRANSVNSSSPYYNYYEYLSHRSITAYSAVELNNAIASMVTASENSYGRTSKLRNMADAFIEKVLVDKNHNIEVVFKFQDEINMLCMRKAS